MFIQSNFAKKEVLMTEKFPFHIFRILNILKKQLNLMYLGLNK